MRRNVGAFKKTPPKVSVVEGSLSKETSRKILKWVARRPSQDRSEGNYEYPKWKNASKIIKWGL